MSLALQQNLLVSSGHTNPQQSATNYRNIALKTSLGLAALVINALVSCTQASENLRNRPGSSMGGATPSPSASFVPVAQPEPTSTVESTVPVSTVNASPLPNVTASVNDTSFLPSYETSNDDPSWSPSQIIIFSVCALVICCWCLSLIATNNSSKHQGQSYRPAGSNKVRATY